MHCSNANYTSISTSTATAPKTCHYQHTTRPVGNGNHLFTAALMRAPSCSAISELLLLVCIIMLSVSP